MEEILNKLSGLGLISKTENGYNTKEFDINSNGDITNNCKLISIDEIGNEIIFEDMYGFFLFYSFEIFLDGIEEGKLTFKIVEPHTSINLTYKN